MDAAFGGHPDPDELIGEFEVWDQYEDDEPQQSCTESESNYKSQNKNNHSVAQNAPQVRSDSSRKEKRSNEKDDGLDALSKVVEALKSQRDRGHKKEAVDSAVNNILKSIHSTLKSDDSSQEKRPSKNVSSTVSPDTAQETRPSSSDTHSKSEESEGDHRSYYSGRGGNRGWNRPFRRPWSRPRGEWRGGGGRGWRRNWSNEDSAYSSESSATENSYNRRRNFDSSRRNPSGWGATPVEPASPYPPPSPADDSSYSGKSSEPGARNPSPPHGKESLSSEPFREPQPQQRNFRSCELLS